MPTKIKNSKTSKSSSIDKKYWRVTLVVGFKSYGEGKTEDDAIKDVYDRIAKNPPIEEYMYKTQLIKGKASKNMTYDEIIKDTDW